jgi:hypothetical protein
MTSASSHATAHRADHREMTLAKAPDGDEGGCALPAHHAQVDADLRGRKIDALSN